MLLHRASWPYSASHAAAAPISSANLLRRVLRRDCGRALRPELGVHGYIHLCSHWSRKPAPLAVFTPATDHLLKPTGLQQQGASRALWSSSLAVGLQCINHGCRKTSLSTVTRMPWFTLVFVISASQEGQQDPSVPLAPDGLGTATQSLVFVISASQEGQQNPSVPLAPDGPGTATWQRAQA